MRNSHLSPRPHPRAVFPLPLRAAPASLRHADTGPALLAARLGLLLVLSVTAALGQSVLTPPPEVPLTPPAMLAYETNRLGTLPPLVNPSGEQESPLRWGPLTLHPHPLYRFLYGDGVPASPTQQVSTVIHEFSPGVELGIGSHVNVDYTPTWRLYSNRRFSDSLDHRAILTAGTTYEDWVLGLSQSYTRSSVPQVETGTQTTEEDFVTALEASYRFNSKLSADLSALQSFVFPEDFAAHREWSTLDWLNFQVWPRFTVGLGAGFGYVDEDVGSDMRYERGFARVAWRVTDKVALTVRAGGEDRHFLGEGRGDLANPLVTGSLQYQPFDHTRLSLTAERSVTPSYFTNQVLQDFALSGQLEQRLLQKLTLTLAGGYSNLKYISAVSSVPINRKDDYYFFNARLSLTVLKRGTVAVFYQYSEDTSNEPGAFSFTSSQVGFELSYRL